MRGSSSAILCMPEACKRKKADVGFSPIIIGEQTSQSDDDDEPGRL